jgi:hypothetical protein
MPPSRHSGLTVGELAVKMIAEAVDGRLFVQTPGTELPRQYKFNVRS